MRTLLLSLAVLLAADMVRAEEPVVHEATKLSFPETLAGFKRGDSAGYTIEGKPLLSVPYHGDGVEATIFVRPADVKNPRTAKQLVDESIATAEKIAGYKDVKKFVGKDDTDAADWAQGGFTAKSAEGAFVFSLVGIKVRDEHVIKLRITASKPDTEKVTAFFKEFQRLAEGEKKLRTHSER